MSDQDMESMTTAPGFRFHPTDEELVSYYLKRKVCGKGFRFDAISEVDVYKNEPWDLPVKSKLKSRDLEWYFFSVLDKKYGIGTRTARATEKGYWKTTGKDREVSHKSNVVGMKKILVYHSGRSPRGKRTNYVMHEYRLVDEKLAKAGVDKDAFVLCRIFLKSGPGPKNGVKYGAPLVEEEWEEEDNLIPGPSKEMENKAVGNDDHEVYLDSSDLEQIFDGKVPVELSFCYGDNSSKIQETPIQGNYHALEKESENQHCSGLQIQNPMDVNTINEELVGETSLNDLDFPLNEPFFDAAANDSFDDVAFLETDDVLNTFKAGSSGVDMVGEYLSFVNADMDTNFQFTPFDSSNLGESENLAADQVFFNPELVNEGAEGEQIGNHQLLIEGYNNDDDALVSKQKPENDDSGGKYSFVEKASQMLGSVSAPPALASEFPSEESALRLSRSLVHLSAGMIQIQKPRTKGTKTSWVLGKNVNISVFLAFGLSHNSADSSLNFQQPPVSEVLTKATPALLRSMMYLMFFWVLILSVTYKIGSCFCSGYLSS